MALSGTVCGARGRRVQLARTGKSYLGWLFGRGCGNGGKQMGKGGQVKTSGRRASTRRGEAWHASSHTACRERGFKLEWVLVRGPAI